MSTTSTTHSPDAQAASSPEAPTTADEPDTAFATDSTSAHAEPATGSTTDQNANVVVPVIVVGLQSVDLNRNNDNAHAHGYADNVQAQDDAHSTESEPRTSGEWRDSPTPGASGGQSQSRGRSWQSRAASALRGLRPGRRTSRNRQTRDAAGARTFLIYVIGGMYMSRSVAFVCLEEHIHAGYYPPNHHMVTGSDSLDSYEALWYVVEVFRGMRGTDQYTRELAELLGQVKPPVATREDIDNSGLQIINSSELSRLEEQGRVASNCVERVSRPSRP